MIQDKVAAAKKIDALLRNIVAKGGFKLKYRITVNPPPVRDQEPVAILVEFDGPDSVLVLERGAELLRSFEVLCHEAV
ncbi:MAG TPA: hypothetical protein VEW69_08280, partial [Alphaproteobacteria bacterium]|nr:hypothetical protein [Alphaproteobacteria bacterium]